MLAIKSTEFNCRRSTDGSLPRENVFSEMEIEQDAIVLKLLGQITQLKEENMALRKQLCGDPTWSTDPQSPPPSRRQSFRVSSKSNCTTSESHASVLGYLRRSNSLHNYILSSVEKPSPVQTAVTTLLTKKKRPADNYTYMQTKHGQFSKPRDCFNERGRSMKGRSSIPVRKINHQSSSP